MAAPAISIGRRQFPVVLPSVRDARLHQSAVLLSLQVLGQTVLGFDLSVVQILLSLGTCAVIEMVLTAWRQGVLAWPASALLTGNGVALILRVPGTRHGDWWSTQGWWIFVVVAAGSLLSKYVIRVDGRHIFNPSNIGLVAGFVLLGAARADPQALWWGDLDAGLAAAIALILLGGVAIVGRLGLLGLALAFWSTLAVLAGVLALSGHCITAPWHVGPVCGVSYWWTLVFSPEIFVFAMFMITDPRTTPVSTRARLGFGAAVGAVAALLVAAQRTEFATKVAVLAALSIVGAAVPVLRWIATRAPSAVAAFSSPVRRLLVAGTSVAVLALGTVAAGASSRPDSFAGRDVGALGAAGAPVLPPGFPTVSLGPSTRELASWYELSTAQWRALDLVTDLDVLAHAVETGDAELARTAASGPWLEATIGQIAAAAGSGTVVVSRYHLDAVTAVMVRVPRSRQPSPEVGFEVAGTMTTTTRASGQGQTDETTTTDTPIRRLFLLRASADGGRWRIHGEGEAWTT